jgi:hypothetical protein
MTYRQCSFQQEIGKKDNHNIKKFDNFSHISPFLHVRNIIFFITL